MVDHKLEEEGTSAPALKQLTLFFLRDFLAYSTVDDNSGDGVSHDDTE